MKIINLPKDAKLAPRLKEVLDLVYVKRPLLEYEVTKYSDNDYAETVRVWQDGQKVGTIYSRFSRYSSAKGMTEIWYAVESHNIKKERGDRNRKFCKDAKVAARTAIEAFTKRTLADLGMSLIKNVKSNVDAMVDRVVYDYRSEMSGVPSIEVANYLTDVHMGKVVPLPKGVTDHIIKRDMLRKRDNYEIAKNVFDHVKADNGYAIKVMQDETLLCVHLGNSQTTSKNQSTYELDQYSQEKFTMLKLLEVNQFAADIGVKYEHDDGEKKEIIYFIVAGKTKVM